MKTITLTVGDQTLASLKSAAMVRNLSGNGHGLLDAAISLIVVYLSEEKTEVNLFEKGDPERP